MVMQLKVQVMTKMMTMISTHSLPYYLDAFLLTALTFSQLLLEPGPKSFVQLQKAWYRFYCNDQEQHYNEYLSQEHRDYCQDVYCLLYIIVNKNIQNIKRVSEDIIYAHNFFWNDLLLQKMFLKYMQSYAQNPFSFSRDLLPWTLF